MSPDPVDPAPDAPGAPADPAEAARALAAELRAIDPDLLALARDARRVAVLTGAGVSAESGVPTFRHPETGLWARYSPQQLATPEAWAEDPALVWAWYLQRARMVRQAQPNPGHRALARWARRPGMELGVVTQNIDDLHERAGSRDVAHVHGSLFAFRCSACERPAEQWQLAGLRLDDPPLEDPRPVDPPECLECDAPIRPGVVWFGEALPQQAFDDGERLMAHADLVLVVGTSSLVQPAASLPMIALGSGTPVAEVNPEATGFTAYADWHVPLEAGRALPVLAAAGR